MGKYKTEEYHNLQSEESLEDADSDYLLLVGEKLKYIGVKYAEDADMVEAVKITNVREGYKDFSNPVYTITDLGVRIYPHPKNEVENGIKIKITIPYFVYPTLDEELVGIPEDYQRVLHPLLRHYIYEKLGDTNNSDRMMVKYNNDLMDAVTKTRGGDIRIVPTTINRTL